MEPPLTRRSAGAGKTQVRVFPPVRRSPLWPIRSISPSGSAAAGDRHQLRRAGRQPRSPAAGPRPRLKGRAPIAAPVERNDVPQVTQLEDLAAVGAGLRGMRGRFFSL
jgi:hypothetical protein